MWNNDRKRESERKWKPALHYRTDKMSKIGKNILNNKIFTNLAILNNNPIGFEFLDFFGHTTRRRIARNFSRMRHNFIARINIWILIVTHRTRNHSRMNSKFFGNIFVRGNFSFWDCLKIFENLLTDFWHKIFLDYKNFFIFYKKFEKIYLKERKYKK